jgi:hypothetical protein
MSTPSPSVKNQLTLLSKILTMNVDAVQKWCEKNWAAIEAENITVANIKKLGPQCHGQEKSELQVHCHSQQPHGDVPPAQPCVHEWHHVVSLDCSPTGLFGPVQSTRPAKRK